jgi:hypothetical protein
MPVGEDGRHWQAERPARRTVPQTPAGKRKIPGDSLHSAARTLLHVGPLELRIETLLAVLQQDETDTDHCHAEGRGDQELDEREP